MLVFLKADGIYKSISDEYKKGGEIARVSLPIEFEGKKYREIIYNKVFLGSVRKGIKGIIFVTEDGKVVEDKRDLRELITLGYHFEVLFDEVFTGSIPRAVTPEKEIKKEENDFNQMIEGLKVLKDEGVHGCDIMINVLSNLPQYKRDNNKALENLIEKIKSLESQDIVFNQKIFDEVMPYYREALIRNFKRVKLINKAREYYDEIKKEAYKRKKKFKYRSMGRDVVEGLTKLEYGINYTKKVLEVYDKVVDMNEEQYLRYLNEMDKDNINHRFELLRL